MYRHGKAADAMEALDAAIAESATSEFARLTRDLGDDEKARRVSCALDSLHGSIRRLEMPEYASALVPLFYSLWYQPFQVNAAYSIIGEIIEQQFHDLTDKGRLEIVDFGSGALAVQFGLALAVLDLPKRRASVPDINISISLVEPSDAMTRTGISIWQRFLTTLGYEIDVDIVALTADARIGAATIRSAQLSNVSNPDARPDSKRWLVAMHAYYAVGKEDIKRDLAKLSKAFKPDLGLFTYRDANLDGIRYVSPFVGSGTPIQIPSLRLKGELHRVNQWRRQLAYELGLTDDDRLTRPVEWDPKRGLRDNRAILFDRG